MRTDIQLIRQNLTVTGCLIQHINEVAVLKNVRHFAGSDYLLSVLLSLIFALAVNFLMYFRMKKIDMVQSLKSVE